MSISSLYTILLSIVPPSGNVVSLFLANQIHSRWKVHDYNILEQHNVMLYNKVSRRGCHIH